MPDAKPPSPDGKWLTVNELAREARVSKMTIYRLINEGVLAATRVGRSVRVHSTTWHEYLGG